MTDKYKFRAGLEWTIQDYREANLPKFTKDLPIRIGPFDFALSPNALYYAAQMGWFRDSSVVSLDNPPPNQDYPNSIIYVEAEIKGADFEDIEEKADKLLDQLEALLRVFLPGDILLRRHISIGMQLNEFVWAAPVFGRPIKPKPEALYKRPPYQITDEGLKPFQEFFTKYWKFVKYPLIKSALHHFNSSYERRTPSDRLLELMIALEALFGDKDYQRYKIPLRCSCILYPRGNERKEAFLTIRDFYDDRSGIVHGTKLDLSPKLASKVDLFEEYVRKSIVKFLLLDKMGHRIENGASLDELLFFSAGDPLWPHETEDE